MSDLLTMDSRHQQSVRRKNLRLGLALGLLTLLYVAAVIAFLVIY
jgi:hypothetical protein